jgi:microcin C transport system substrate-binding protein
MLATPRAALAALVLLAALTAASPLAAEARHGLSTFGDLKYPPDFAHFAYANPAAPKGGEARTWALETFDNLNPLILKGIAAAGVELGLTFETLMTPARDEPDSLYGLIAQTVEIGPGRASAAFNLDPRARWHDGSPITADDVVFTYNATITEGHPQYRILYRDVEGIEAASPRRVVFRFKPGDSRRDLPLLVAQMTVMSKAWFKGRDFAATVLDPPMASGPYRIERVDPGRAIVYRRVADYWGKDLPVNNGRHNFDRVRFDYYRDRDIALEAFFAGEYDWREEFTARNWSTMYEDRPAMKSGQVKREELADETPSGVQAFFLNTRREKFKDRRVRMALNLAMDFEWMNRTLFYGLYSRTRSMFENSELAATGLPSPAELALLNPYRAQLPPEVFTTEYQSPRTDAKAGQDGARENLRAATQLLAEAGWTIKGKTLTNSRTGEPFTIEFLNYEATFQRVVNPYIRSLERLGIEGSIRVVDVTAFENRRRNFDYDVVIGRFSQPLTPGVEQRNYWGAANADMAGGLNYSGVKEPVVDALIERIVSASSRQELLAATRALDRVLMWGAYTVPQWYSGKHRLAYWEKFGRPAVKPKYDIGLLDTWWVDQAKEARLPEKIRSPRN